MVGGTVKMEEELGMGQMTASLGMGDYIIKIAELLEDIYQAGYTQGRREALEEVVGLLEKGLDDGRCRKDVVCKDV